MLVKHLPYQIDPGANRFHFYEQLWKDVAFGLLQAEQSSLAGWSHLDYGCGRGESMRMAAQWGMETQGTDIDSECLRLSSQFGRTILREDGAPVDQFGENSYDLVTCFHVLEHVPSPVETLRSLAKMARKRVLVAVPNLSAFHDLLRPHSHWDRPINEGHLQSWDHAHFRNLAETHCGLKILSWGFDAVMLPPFTHWLENWFGSKPAIALETGPLKRLFPYASLSVIALMEPV